MAEHCPWRLSAGTLDVGCQHDDPEHLRVADTPYEPHHARSDEGWGVEWTSKTTGAYRYPLAEADRDSYARLIGTLDQLGTILRGARTRRGLTGRQAAAAIGVSPSTVSRVEHGEHGASLGAVVKILRWIGDVP